MQSAYVVYWRAFSAILVYEPRQRWGFILKPIYPLVALFRAIESRQRDYDDYGKTAPALTFTI